MKAVLLAIVVFFCLSAHAQVQPPSREELLAAIQDADYAFRRFEEVSDKVNFSRWNVAYELISSAENDLSGARRETRRTRSTIIGLRNAATINASDVFEVFDLLLALDGTAIALSHNTRTYARDLQPRNRPSGGRNDSHRIGTHRKATSDQANSGSGDRVDTLQGKVVTPRASYVALLGQEHT